MSQSGKRPCSAGKRSVAPKIWKGESAIFPRCKGAFPTDSFAERIIVCVDSFLRRGDFAVDASHLEEGRRGTASQVCGEGRAFPAPDTTTQSSHPLSTGPEQTRPLCGTQQTLLRTLATLSPGDLPQDGKRLPRSRLDGPCSAGKSQTHPSRSLAQLISCNSSLRKASTYASIRFSVVPD
jgi:hypothetical protein